jgi:hypothetical protein
MPNYSKDLGCDLLEAYAFGEMLGYIIVENHSSLEPMEIMICLSFDNVRKLGIVAV